MLKDFRFSSRHLFENPGVDPNRTEPNRSPGPSERPENTFKFRMCGGAEPASSSGVEARAKRRRKRGHRRPFRTVFDSVELPNASLPSLDHSRSPPLPHFPQHGAGCRLTCPSVAASRLLHAGGGPSRRGPGGRRPPGSTALSPISTGDILNYISIHNNPTSLQLVESLRISMVRNQDKRRVFLFPGNKTIVDRNL